MSYLSGVKNYIERKDFACPSFAYSIVENKWTQEADHYQFNLSERIGNQLLEPMKWVFHTLDETDSYIIYYSTTVLGVFTAAVALIGALFKKLGENFNPYSEKRYEAMDLQVKLRNESNFFELFAPAVGNMLNVCKAHMTGLRLDNLFKQKILKEKQGATDDEVFEVWPKGGLLGIFAVFVPKLPETEHLNELRQLVKQWSDAWQEFAQKIRSQQDFSETEQSIKQLVSEDETTHDAVCKYFNQLREDREHAQRLKEMNILYDKTVRQMVYA